MSNKLKSVVDAAVGEYNWFIAGGAAAYWHIENYAQNGPRQLHDVSYYDSIHQLIFPGDIEGNAIKKVEIDFAGKYGIIHVELQEMAKDRFDESKLDKIDGIYVFNKDSIISRYQTTQGKPEKRNTRIALLRIIQQGIGITDTNVRGNTPRGLNIGMQIGQGFKLKPASDRDKKSQ